MIDEIRRMSDIPRSAVANLKAHGRGQQATCRNPSAGNLPKPKWPRNLASPTKRFQNERTHAHRFQTLAYEDVEQEVDGVTAAPELDPSVLVADQEGLEALEEAIGTLPSEIS